ncbi:pesticin C-terminus-like muramidase [Aeromonas veronii]|uniref:pesticin C-terminus-like muramidase n=1 Tax=Aeromonas veronii TaxID=654 RepID=UPI001115B448|nr:pesticin C-terminus-like muramidase [Aeromonas veronii]TNI01716.1 hypothetical protein CF135_21340 [Aeromonas veronii]HDO1310718.1 hypothetical protein [Aeromonas veronii]
MKIVYPMQLAGENGSSEIASLDEFIKKINGLKSGTFPIGRNRIWHGGIHFSKSGGWHPSGAVRAIADGEIVAYRLATKPAKATRSTEEGKPEGKIDLYTSPSFCLVRHRYEAGEQNKNRLTFYSLYMHIACENSYNSSEAARVMVKGTGVSTYKPVVEGTPPKLIRRLSGDKPVYAKRGAEVKLVGQEVKNLLNHKDEPHDYYLVHYVDDPDSLFHIAASQLQQEFPQKPTWMTPPEGKPARHKVPGNTWLRKSADTTAESLGLPAGSEVVISGEPAQMISINGGTTEFRKVQVFKVGSGTVKDSANQVMTNASKGAVGWLAKSKMGAGLTAEPSIPVEFKDDAVVDRSANPIPVQAGEIIGHWGEHELATAGASGFEKDADSKAVHFEVFVAESDKQVLEDCINNKARVTGGQGYLLVKKKVTTYRLTSDSKHGFHEVANFGPLVLPLAVKESDIVTHGANNFVKVRERTAADGELAGEFVLQGGDVEVISQHDWHKLGVKLVDGSSDDDGFLDKADTESEEPQQKEASKFFSTLYDKLVTDGDNDGTLSGNDIKAALADEELAGKLRMLFIKHKSEWVKPGDWPRLKQELAEQPKLYEYAMQVHNNMAWMEDASAILGDTKPWFIHPAGMIGLVADPVSDDEMDEKWFIVTKGQLTFDAEGNDVENSTYFSRKIHWPGNSESGVTIGRGYDIGSRSKEDVYRDLSDSGVPDNIASLISSGAGIKGGEASSFVSENKNSTLITRKSQHLLFEKIYPDYVLRAKSNYERWTTAQSIQDANIPGVSISDKTNWESLDDKVKDVIVDLVYQGFTKGPRPMVYGMLNDRQKYADYIKNNPSLSQYEPGRNRAKYLTGE